MSDDENKEVAMKQEDEEPTPQQSPDDTTNWDDKDVSTPDGEKNIRSE